MEQTGKHTENRRAPLRPDLSSFHRKGTVPSKIGGLMCEVTNTGAEGVSGSDGMRRQVELYPWSSPIMTPPHCINCWMASLKVSSNVPSKWDCRRVRNTLECVDEGRFLPTSFASSCLSVRPTRCPIFSPHPLPYPQIPDRGSCHRHRLASLFLAPT